MSESKKSEDTRVAVDVLAPAFIADRALSDAELRRRCARGQLHCIPIAILPHPNSNLFCTRTTHTHTVELGLTDEDAESSVQLHTIDERTVALELTNAGNVNYFKIYFKIIFGSNCN